MESYIESDEVVQKPNKEKQKLGESHGKVCGVNGQSPPVNGQFPPKTPNESYIDLRSRRYIETNVKYSSLQLCTHHLFILWENRASQTDTELNMRVNSFVGGLCTVSKHPMAFDTLLRLLMAFFVHFKRKQRVTSMRTALDADALIVWHIVTSQKSNSAYSYDIY